MANTIEETFPDYVITGSDIRFLCPDCEIINSSRKCVYHGNQLVVCGNCWMSYLEKDVDELFENNDIKRLKENQTVKRR